MTALKAGGRIGRTSLWRGLVKDFPIHLSDTPAHSGGTLQRGFPCNVEDNDYVYGTLLGVDEGDITL